MTVCQTYFCKSNALTLIPPRQNGLTATLADGASCLYLPSLVGGGEAGTINGEAIGRELEVELVDSCR
jgi:hypothetical protein